MKKLALLFVAALMVSFLMTNCTPSPEKMAKKVVKAMCDEDEDAAEELKDKGEDIMKDMTDEEKEEWTDDFMKALEKEMKDVDDDCKKVLGMD